MNDQNDGYDAFSILQYIPALLCQSAAGRWWRRVARGVPLTFSPSRPTSLVEPEKIKNKNEEMEDSEDGLTEDRQTVKMDGLKTNRQ